MDCCWLWAVGLVILFKALDRLIRVPYIRGMMNRYVLITGCDTGFGHECAKQLDRIGVNVFAGCLTEKGETILTKQCSGRLKTVPLNVADPASVRKAVEFVKSNLPANKGLWGVVNNAGIVGTVGPVEWLIKADYEEVLNVNLHGLIDVTVAFLPLVKKARGRIVNTSSVFGRVPLPGSTPYTISKYGVEAFSDILRKQLRPYKCSVHLIEPGFHKTNITSQRTVGGGLARAWDRLDPEMKAEYGQEYFDKANDVIVTKMINDIASDRIEDVVSAYEHALLAICPRARYVIGKDAHFFWLPLHYLPEWLGDLLQEQLARDRPIAAAVKK